MKWLSELNIFKIKNDVKKYRCESDQKVLYLAGLWVGEGDFGLGGEINLVLPLESSRDCLDPTWRYQNHFFSDFNSFYVLTTQGWLLSMRSIVRKMSSSKHGLILTSYDVTDYRGDNDVIWSFYLTMLFPYIGACIGVTNLIVTWAGNFS